MPVEIILIDVDMGGRQDVAGVCITGVGRTGNRNVIYRVLVARS